MKQVLAAAVLLCGLLTASTVVQAQTIINAYELNLVATAPASYNGNGTQINFPGSGQGDARIELTLLAGNYTLNVSGATNANSRFSISFGSLLIAAAADLQGNGNDIQSFSFVLNANTTATLLFTPVVSPGANFEGHLDALQAAVPGPVAGAGIPALLCLIGVLAWRRGRQKLKISAK